MITKVQKSILLLFLIAAETIYAGTPLEIVSSFGKTLANWCQTDNIECRVSLERLCSGLKNCRVEDKVLADYLFKKGLPDHETFCLDTYLNMFEEIIADGTSFNMNNIKVETQDVYPDGQILTFITADITIKGTLNYEIKNLFLVRDNKISGIYGKATNRAFVHLNGSLIKALQDDEFFSVNVLKNGHIVLKKGSEDKYKEGIIDVKGNVVVPFIWDGILYNGGLFAVGENLDSNRDMCVYDLRQGGKPTPIERLPELEFDIDSTIMDNDYIPSFEDGYMVVYNKTGKCGFLQESDLTYNKVSYQYDKASKFNEGYALVTKEETSYIVDKKLKIVLSDNADYKLCSTPHDGFIKVRNKNSGKYGMIDLSGKLRLPFKYEAMGVFNNGLCKIAKLSENNIQVAFINKQGHFVIPFDSFEDYDSNDFRLSYIIAKKHVASSNVRFEDDSIYEEKDYRSTLIGIDGRPLPGFNWDYFIYGFQEGLALFSDKEKYGFLNKMGEVAILPTFTYAECFINGYACVGKDIFGELKYGCINTDGVLVVPYVYDEPFCFDNGIALVNKAGKTGLIDAYGNSSF